MKRRYLTNTIGSFNETRVLGVECVAKETLVKIQNFLAEWGERDSLTILAVQATAQDVVWTHPNITKLADSSTARAIT